MRWRKEKQTDQWGRTGWSYFSDDGQWEISDEGPAPWLLLRRYNGAFRFHSDNYTTLAAAKACARKEIKYDNIRSNPHHAR